VVALFQACNSGSGTMDYCNGGNDLAEEYPFPIFVYKNPSACKLVQDLHNDQESSDVQLDVGVETNQATFYAHRLILKKAAPMLADLITTSLADTAGFTIPEDEQVFEVLLRYIYGYDSLFSEFDLTQTMKIIDIANKYGVTGLKLEAEAHMVYGIKVSFNNVIDILHFADAKTCALLKEAALVFIHDNPSEIVQSGLLSHLPEGLLKDMLVVMAMKEKKKKAVRELNLMSVGELQHKAHEED
jgi:BTB/POZ domain